MFAGFWRRLGAIILDTIVLFIILVAYIAVMVLVFKPGANATAQNASGFALLMGTFNSLFFIFMPILYFSFFEASSMQATPGKLAFGIKVTDMQGNRIGFWHAFGRNIAKMVSNATFYIGYVMAGFTVRKQALHDKLANTLVITKEADGANLQPMAPAGTGKIILLCAAALLPMFILVLIIIAVLFAASMPQYTAAVEKSRATEALVTINTIAKAQERYLLETASSRMPDLEMLDIYPPGDIISPRVLETENFIITLQDKSIMAQRKLSTGQQYTIAKCYVGGKVCCSGLDSICTTPGFTVAPADSCCN